jgi:hypothetical protein
LKTMGQDHHDQIGFGDLILNVISAYALQDLSEDVKRRFWEDLDDMIKGVSSSEKLFIEENLNDHVGTAREGFENVHEVLNMTNRIKREKKS